VTKPDPVTVPIRLTRQEARRIYEGLRLLQVASYLKEHPALCPTVFLSYGGRHDFDHGRFDAELNRPLETAFSKIVSISGTSKRLQMTVFEIAACMLGLRWTATRLQRGRFIPPGVKLNVPLSTQVAMARGGRWKRSLDRQVARVRPRYLAAVKRLMQKLENSRKRAKRAYLQAYGEECYREYERRWKGHVRWVRVHMMEVGSRRLRAQWPGRKRRYRERFEDWVAGVREALEADKLPAPSEEELVRVVQKALRSAKRFQRTLSRSMSIPERRELLNEHIWNIIDRDCLSYVRNKARQDVYDRIYRAAGIDYLESTDEEKSEGKERKPQTKKNRVRQPGRHGSAQALH